MENCTWELAKRFVLDGKEKDFISYELDNKCSLSSAVYCKGPGDEVPCLLNDEKEYLSWIGGRTGCQRFVGYLGGYEKESAHMPEKCQKKRINILRPLNKRFKYIPLNPLASYVKKQLSKPKTALLTTEATIGIMWKQ